ncbi:hypothetical protein FOL47_004063, partial [Perkinsus chesapeaki]
AFIDLNKITKTILSEAQARKKYSDVIRRWEEGDLEAGLGRSGRLPQQLKKIRNKLIEKSKQGSKLSLWMKKPSSDSSVKTTNLSDDVWGLISDMSKEEKMGLPEPEAGQKRSEKPKACETKMEVEHVMLDASTDETKERREGYAEEAPQLKALKSCTTKRVAGSVDIQTMDDLNRVLGNYAYADSSIPGLYVIDVLEPE